MKTCGTCRHTEMVPNDMTSVRCFGMPPVPVLMPVRVGNTMDMQIQLMRPHLARTERACALHESVVLVGANADAAG